MAAMTLDDIDSTGLIREAYRIEGITDGECRSIFVDWALRLPPEYAAGDAIGLLLATYAGADPDRPAPDHPAPEHPMPDHPMTAVLKAGLSPAGPPTRRGGRSGRLRR